MKLFKMLIVFLMLTVMPFCIQAYENQPQECVSCHDKVTLDAGYVQPTTLSEGYQFFLVFRQRNLTVAVVTKQRLIRQNDNDLKQMQDEDYWSRFEKEPAWA